jgi:hypothetical protein
MSLPIGEGGPANIERRIEAIDEVLSSRMDEDSSAAATTAEGEGGGLRGAGGGSSSSTQISIKPSAAAPAPADALPDLFAAAKQVAILYAQIKQYSVTNPSDVTDNLNGISNTWLVTNNRYQPSLERDCINAASALAAAQQSYDSGSSSE